MNKRILVISNEKSLPLGLYNEKGSKGSIELITELRGSYAYESIREKKPDLIIVDLETPGLSRSWVSMQLEGIDIKEQVPTVAVSRLLNREEREILSDLTGVPIHSTKARLSQLVQGIETSLN
jgi:DNA-binding NarL/FixJ family response regulator